jgi:hypothetical protein
VRFNPRARGLDQHLQYLPYQTRYGFYRSLETTASWIEQSIEQQSGEQTFAIPSLLAVHRRPKTKKDAEDLARKHDNWRGTLLQSACIVYTDGPQTADHHNGVGWFIEIKKLKGSETATLRIMLPGTDYRSNPMKHMQLLRL